MKQLHWTLPFASLDGNLYRINIYSDNAPAVSITLKGVGIDEGGPLTTDCDTSENFFESIRSQTGSIHIVNTSGELSIYDILPENNTDRPVAVFRESDYHVMWRGFLRAEEYSQGYNDRPKQIDLNIISTLESLGTIRMSESFFGLKRIRQILYQANIQLEDVSRDLVRFRYAYFPADSYSYIDKMIDTTLFMSIKENDDENNIMYSVECDCFKDIIEKICKPMGWCAVEDGRDLFFIKPSVMLPQKMGFMRIEFYKLNNEVLVESDFTHVGFVAEQMSDLHYHGMNHTISVREGAHSVEVVAQLKRNDTNINLPDECPVGDLDATFTKIDINDQEGAPSKCPDEWVYLMANRNSKAISNIKYNYYSCKVANFVYPSSDIVATDFQSITPETFFGQKALSSRATGGDPRPEIPGGIGVVWKEKSPASIIIHPHTGTPTYMMGAFLAKAEFQKREWKLIHTDDEEDFPKTYHHVESGLYCVSLPKQAGLSDCGPIATIENVLPFVAVKGYLKLTGSMVNIDAVNYFGLCYFRTENPNLKHPVSRITMRLKFGDKYYDQQYMTWTTTPKTMVVKMQDGGIVSNWKDIENYWENNGQRLRGSMIINEEDGLLIPIENYMTGHLTLEILPFAETTDSSFACECFFKSLDLDYVPIASNFRTDRTENHYYKVLSANFKEEVSINTHLASSLFNNHSFSILMDNESTDTENVTIDMGLRKEQVRPEKELLDSMGRYYSSPRKIVSLEIDPLQNSTPLVRITGYDGKIYLPLSESRNWGTGVSTIRCFETPGTPPNLPFLG